MVRREEGGMLETRGTEDASEGGVSEEEEPKEGRARGKRCGEKSPFPVGEMVDGDSDGDEEDRSGRVEEGSEDKNEGGRVTGEGEADDRGGGQEEDDEIVWHPAAAFRAADGESVRGCSIL